MKLSRIATSAAITATIVLAACSENTKDPQLSMCQAVAKQLSTNGIAGWERTSQEDKTRFRHVDIDFSTVDDNSGSIRCSYPIDEQGNVATGPETVRFNGEPVDRKTLLTAGVAASKELIAGTAADTAEAAREFANEAGDKARELADQAGDKAREVAGQAVGTAVEAGQALQEKLEQ